MHKSPINKVIKLVVVADSCFCAPQVEDPRIARLIDGQILIGRDLGITTIQVCTACSLSHYVLNILVNIIIPNHKTTHSPTVTEEVYSHSYTDLRMKYKIK